MAETCPICGASIARFPCPACGWSPSPPEGGSRPEQLEPGAQLQDRYRIVKFLAQGGMGSVYQGYDERLNQDCILKELLDEGDPTDRTQRLDLFRQEAQMLANLHHPHIAAVWDYFTDRGRHYIVEEFLPGGTLDQFKEPLPEPRVVQWAVQIAEALDYLHRQQIVYRDMKPDNILLRVDQRAVMADFGIARFFKPGKQRDTTRFVTFGYAPLEQLGENFQTTPASDIYAFGAMLYRLLTGKPPETWLTAQNFAQFPPLRSVKADVSPELAGIAERCVRFKIAERYADGGALLEALRPLWLRWEAARCACGQQNRPAAAHCTQCGKLLLKPQIWNAAYPGPFTRTGSGEYGVAWKIGLGEGVRAHPAIWDGQILAAGEAGTLYALDMEGYIVSRTRLGAPSRSSPTVIGGAVWMGTSRGLAGPGGLFPTGSEVFAPPCSAPEGLYVVDYAGGLTALTMEGRVRWQRQVAGSTAAGEGILPPVVTEQGVIAMTKRGRAACFSPNGELRWEAAAGENVYGWPVLDGHRIVFLDSGGRLQVWDGMTGQSLLKVAIVGPAYNGLAHGSGAWIAASRSGLVYAMDDTFHERWRTSVTGEIVASPVVVGDRIVVGDRQGALHFLDLASGSERSAIQTGGDWVAPVVAGGNAVIGATKEGTVWCLVSANS